MLNVFQGILGLVFLSTTAFVPPLGGNVPVQDIVVPSGFSIKVFAEVPNARSMVLGDKGTLFVGTRRDKVYAVVDTDRDRRADRVQVIAEGLNMPNGVAFRNGDLYVAEVSRILRYESIESRLDDPPQPVVIRDDYPQEKSHGWKYIAFGPDEKLYVPVGAPCNICKSDDPRFASITRISPDGGDFEIFARGIRNTVGFDWHPETGVLWFTNNGRDWMGDDMPPDTLHRAPSQGLHFGFPYCHAGDIPDPDFGQQRKCSEFMGSVLDMPAHVAALGMVFYQGGMFPQEYRGDIFIAEHGSWNRSTPIGYRVSRVRLDGSKVQSYQPFATGWLQDGEAWGRPVDVLVMDDGSMLVSDDRAGVVYRIVYGQ